MVELGEVWTSGGRSVRVVGRERSRVIVRDTYGLRRRMAEEELRRGFRRVTAGDPVEAARAARGVMARRSLADVDPS